MERERDSKLIQMQWWSAQAPRTDLDWSGKVPHFWRKGHNDDAVSAANTYRLVNSAALALVVGAALDR